MTNQSPKGDITVSGPLLSAEGDPIDCLKVFVAMPGSDFGPNAFYKTPESVQENFLDPVCDRLSLKLNLHVDLKIEKDKTQAGDIYQSMYREARDAHVYIADLTGANPNVYLELGVRWTLREFVTVPIVQDPADLRFNVSKSRVQVYTPQRLMKAITDLTETILHGLYTRKCDSPILTSTEIVWMTRAEKDELEAQVAGLRSKEARVLLRRAKLIEDDLPARIDALTDVLELEPTSAEAARLLGIAYRESGQYADAEEKLKRAIEIDPEDYVAHRELGVLYSKSRKDEEALRSLRKALELNREDPEIHSNLGGALRRIATQGDTENWDRVCLRDAHDCYETAARLDRFDLYSALNVARTGMILAKWDNHYMDQAREVFRRQIHLALYVIDLNPGNHWGWLDLADCYLLTGQLEDARKTLTQALEVVPKEKRHDTLSSYLNPLKDFLLLGVLDPQTEDFVQTLVKQH